MRKRILALALSLGMIFSLAAGCSSGTKDSANSNSSAPQTQTDMPDDTVYTLVWAVGGSESGDAITPNFVELIEERSNGRVKVETHFDGTLGSGNELVESLLLGNIQVTFDSTANHANFVPGLAILDVPFLFEDIKDLQSAMEGDFGVLLEELYAEAGLKCIGLGTRGFRWTTTNREIKEISDFKGLKIRTMTNSYHLAAWEAIGANPTPLAFSELYLALSQGTVDAQENPLENITLSNLQEVQKYVINTRHVAAGVGVIMNLDYWNSLPVDVQALIEECMNEVMTAFWARQVEAENASLQTILDAGVTLIELTDAQRTELKKLAQPAVAELVRKDLGDDLTNRLLEAAGVTID